MAEKRLVISTATPNDQGGIIPNETIDISRFMKNPVLLEEHCWGVTFILGKVTDLRYVNGEWSCIPVFHLETQKSREAAGMWEKGALNACSIGGEAIWKQNPVTNEYIRDAQGYKICEKFFLYEVSMVALPSNEDAVGKEGLSSMYVTLYENQGVLEQLKESLVTLSSNFQNNFSMSEVKKPGEGGAEPAKTEPGAAAGATTLAAEPGKTALAAEPGVNELPSVIATIIKNGGSVTFSSGSPAFQSAVPAPSGEPESKQGERVNGEAQPEPIGLKAKAALAAFLKMQKAQQKLGVFATQLAKAKKEAESDDADDEMKSAFATLQLSADVAMKDCESAEKEYEKAKEEADDEELAATQKKAGKTGLGSAHRPEPTHVQQAQTPVMLSAKEMAAQLKLAAEPSFKARVGKESQGITFSKLNSPLASESDKKLMRRVSYADKNVTDVNIADHAVVLNSMLNDSRLKPIMDKVRLNVNVSVEQMNTMRQNPDFTGKRGNSLEQLSSDFNAGRVQYRNRTTGQMENITMLTSTDNALASPALNTIEWLSLAIFQLFPTTSWKSQIPMFGAQMTSKNTGLIFANVVANPAIYRGTSPAPAGDYVYTDQAVALALTPYWLQPMLWNPLTMHQLRYDQMATGWAQAFAKWNAVMDDNLLYTLASTVPASAIVPTSGLSGYQVNPQQFNIPASGAQNQFYWNPAYAGNLLYPTLNDIIALEQVYRNQNFEMEKEKAVIVIDPIMERYFSQDPEMKSLLTAWVSRDGESFVAFKHTLFDNRSRVIVYDPATGQVKDINAAIPATAQSAALGFIPSQVGMGIGMLDVFMIQDPTNYGYRMSADIRIGIVPLRYNFFGTSLLIYGVPNV